MFFSLFCLVKEVFNLRSDMQTRFRDIQKRLPKREHEIHNIECHAWVSDELKISSLSDFDLVVMANLFECRKTAEIVRQNKYTRE